MRERKPGITCMHVALPGNCLTDEPLAVFLLLRLAGLESGLQVVASGHQASSQMLPLLGPSDRESQVVQVSWLSGLLCFVHAWRNPGGRR